MLIGLDFDNTIVCYDHLFHRVAVERDLIPATTPATKHAVRECLRTSGQDGEWTELQGIVYGPRITDAVLFPGVKEFLAQCREAGVQVTIISHKTRYPYRGERHDLHAAAHTFLEAHGFFTSDTGLSPESVYLELTLPDKLAKIGLLGCAAFVDDLPELLAEPAFPAGVRKVLFDAVGAHPTTPEYIRVTSWNECYTMLTDEEVLA